MEDGTDGVTDLEGTQKMSLCILLVEKNRIRRFHTSSADVDQVARIKFPFNYFVLLSSKTPRFIRFIAFF